MNDITLRPYQQKFIDNVRNEFLNGNKRVVGVAPCGAGKTIMTGWMIKESVLRDKRSIFFVHRHELIEQTSKTFTRLDIPHGIIDASTDMQLDLPVQIASVQTLIRRLDKIPEPDFLICDECHHILARSYLKVLDAYPNAFLLGVTATPQRMGGITLCDVFDSMVPSLSVDDLITLGNLTPFKYFAPSIGVDLHNVRIKYGEYVNSDLEHIMTKGQFVNSVVDNYRKLIDEKSAICYCVNVNHSKLVANAFNNAGISAAHCDGETPKLKRAEIVNNFRQGNIKVLCNAELFGEGFDVPNCQAVILARPTHSLTLFIQQALRPLRPDPEDTHKVAVILDLVQNYLRHGLPNKNHHWSLEPNFISEKEIPKRLCPQCNAVCSYNSKVCPECGYTFPVSKEKDEQDITELDDTLAEVDICQNTKDTFDHSVKRAFSEPEQFLLYAKEHNYKIGWVAFKSLEHANSYEDCLHIAEICGYNKGWAWHKWQELAKKNTLCN